LIEHHPSSIGDLQGWCAKVIILISEIAARCEHFRNYRQFMREGGIPALVKRAGHMIEKQRIVSGGPLGLFLISAHAAS
jgi:hypothetical protein